MCGSLPSIDHETAYRLTLYLWSEGFYSRLALVCTIKIHISLTCLFFFFGLSSVDSEVLSGAGRPVGGAGPEGDTVLRCLQLYGHRSVDQRWAGSGHRRGSPG